jgi:WD40 repeat protein
MHVSRWLLVLLVMPFGLSASAQLPADDEPLPAGAFRRLGSVGLRHGAAGISVALSPDGKLLASAGEDFLGLWDATTGKPLEAIRADPGRLDSVVFSPDGKLRRWRTEGGVGPAVFSPNGKLLVWRTTGKLLIFDVQKRKQILTLAGNPGKLNRMAFAPDSQTVAVPCDDHVVRLWDVTTGKLVRELKRHTAAVVAAVFLPDGKTLLSADSKGTLVFWDVDSGKETRRLAPQERAPTAALALTRDGKQLAIACGPISWGGDDPIPFRVLDVASGKQQFRLESKYRFFPAIAFAPDGGTVALGLHPMSGASDSVIELREAGTGKLIRRLQGHGGSVCDLVFSGDGQTLVSIGSEGFVRIWNVADGSERTSHHGHGAAVSVAAYSPNGKLLASGAQDWSLVLWNAETGKRLHILRAFYDAPRWLVFTPDGQHLLSSAFNRTELGATSDTTAILWNTASGKEVRRFYPVIGGLALTPDGKTFAAGDLENGIQLWNVATGEMARTLTGHQALPTAVAFSPDGQVLASASADGDVRLWRHATGQEVRRLIGPGAKTPPIVLVFTADGRYLAVGTADGGIRLWEAATGQLAASVKPRPGQSAMWLAPSGRFVLVRGPEGGIESFDFFLDRRTPVLPKRDGLLTVLTPAPDGQTLATGYTDGTLLLWNEGDLLKPAPLPAVKPSAKQVQALWQDLAGDDGQAAYRARWELAASPVEVMPLLREQLRPASAPTPKKLAQQLADFGSDKYKVREQARRDLEQYGDVAIAPLRLVLDGKPSLEVRQRIENILRKLEGLPLEGETLRAVRAIAVLETIAAPAARELLGTLARGAPGARVTEAAQQALERGRQLGKGSKKRGQAPLWEAPFGPFRQRCLSPFFGVHRTVLRTTSAAGAETAS